MKFNVFSISIVSILFSGGLSAKTLVVGEALRFEDKYNDTISHFAKGFETAKALFEHDHPETKIDFKRFAHDANLESVVETAGRIIKSQVPAVVGGEMSSEAKVFGDLLEPQKIVFISHTGSSPIVTVNKSYVFRAGFADEQVAKALAMFVVDKIKPGKIGIFANISNPHSSYISEEFEKQVNLIGQRTGKTIPVVIQKVISGVDDYSKNVDFFKAAGVTHLVSFVTDSNFTNLVVQAGRKDFFPVYIGSDAWGSNRYVFSRFVENSSQGNKFVAYRSYYWKEDSHGPMADRFTREFKNKYHESPNAWNAVAFDAAWILFTAMDRAKNPKSSDEIRKELLKLRNVHLVTTNRFAFGENNAAQKDIPIYKLSRAGIEYQGNIR